MTARVHRHRTKSLVSVLVVQNKSCGTLLCFFFFIFFYFLCLTYLSRLTDSLNNMAYMSNFKEGVSIHIVFLA